MTFCNLINVGSTVTHAELPFSVIMSLNLLNVHSGVIFSHFERCCYYGFTENITPDLLQSRIRSKEYISEKAEKGNEIIGTRLIIVNQMDTKN